MYAGLAIYDTMQFIKPDVQTICVGMAMSMGAVILAGGTQGKRLALPHSKIMIHQGSPASTAAHGHRDPGARGDQPQAADGGDHGQPHGAGLEKIAKDMDRDYYMTAEEAKEYGVIDTVVSSRDPISRAAVA